MPIKIKQIDHKHRPITYLMFNGEKKHKITTKESQDVEAIDTLTITDRER